MVLGGWRTDKQMDGWTEKKWHAERGVPPKNMSTNKISEIMTFSLKIRHIFILAFKWGKSKSEIWFKHPTKRVSTRAYRHILRSEKIFDNSNPLKMMKNAFCFTLKALFVLKIFRFLSWLFGHVEKTTRLER